ncbi:hypothetical protein SANTM175S_03364 [Streptomyces antimycoticus]
MTRDSEVVRLAVIPGDGIGPEVVAATVPTLRTALEAEGHRLDVTSYDWEASGTSGRARRCRPMRPTSSRGRTPCCSAPSDVPMCRSTNWSGA